MILDLPVAGVLGPSLREIPAAGSSLRWLYRWLEDARGRLGTDELTLVLDDPQLGRQVFRAGRAPLKGPVSERIALRAAPGLYATPPVRFDPEEVRVLSRLCSLALDRDLARVDATSDPLTALHNRRSFDAQLDAATADHRRYGRPFTVVLVDIDAFKSVNDERGHAVGDRVLASFADALRESLRRGDAAARLGGDEFGLVLVGTDGTREVIARISERVAARCPDPQVRFSTGVASCPEDGDEVTSLLAVADQRLYEDKRRG